MRLHSTSLLLFATALFAVPAFSAPPTFAARLGLSVPNEIFTTGDYNKDGNLDIISVTPDSNSTTGDYELSVQFGNGKGSFVQGPTYDLGPNFLPTAIAAADVNGDGLLDVVVLSPSTSSLYIILQRKGREPVITPIEVFNTAGALDIGIGDLNGDGQPDLVIPSEYGTYVLFNQGRGNFASPEMVSSQGEAYVVLADLNGDKNLDLVLSSSNCCGLPLTVLLGDGHGDFTAPAYQPSFYNNNPYFAVADINQDGKLDIAIGSQYSESISIALGNGDGTFQTPESISLPTNFSEAYTVAAGDLNKDGIPDLAVLASGPAGYAMVTFLNQGHGVFGAPSSYPVQQSASFVKLAPIVTRSGTGAANDALVSSPGTGSVISVLLNNGTGVFLDGTVTGPAAQSNYLVTGDFNSDGHLDIASVSQSGLSILLNTGTNSNLFSAETPLPFFTGPLVAGDFNRDGRLDLVAIDQTTAQLLIGEGNGEFRLKLPVFSIGNTASAAVAADMNGDGKLDIVTSAPAVILGSGGGNFEAPLFPPSGGCGSSFVATADFNRDGKQDILTNCYNQLEILPGNGDGTVGYPIFLTYSEYGITGAAVGDFNHDGIPDIAFVSTFYGPSTTGSQVTIEVGNGDGTFQQKATLVVPGGYAYYGATSIITVGNFNGDENLDVAVLDPGDATVAILPGNGDGTFGLPVLYGTGSNPLCIVPGSLQNPARPLDEDLMFCSAGGVSLDLNTTK